MLAKIREVLLILNKDELILFQKLLRDGTELGMKISYAIQEKPDGIASAFKIGREFISDDSVALILGDNLIYGSGLTGLLNEAKINTQKGYASIFLHPVRNPSQFGVAILDSNKEIIQLIEKPTSTNSNLAIIGLYFYDNSVLDIVETLTYSKRGELEITDLNNLYLNQKKIKSISMGRGYTWFDNGSIDSLYRASEFVRVIEENGANKVACIEEISFQNNWITLSDLKKTSSSYSNSLYGKYLLDLIGRHKS